MLIQFSPGNYPSGYTEQSDVWTAGHQVWLSMLIALLSIISQWFHQWPFRLHISQIKKCLRAQIVVTVWCTQVMASVSDPSASRLRETFTLEWPDTASHYLVLYNMRPVSPVPSSVPGTPLRLISDQAKVSRLFTRSNECSSSLGLEYRTGTNQEKNSYCKRCCIMCVDFEWHNHNYLSS